MSISVLDDGESKPAPGELRLVQAFVNTRDPYHGSERLKDAESLGSWMRGAGLLTESATAPVENLEEALELREALRELLITHNGGESTRRAVEDLKRLASALPLQVRFDEQAQAFVARPAATVRGTLGALLGLVLYADASGVWGRLKACANPECRWVFYDASKNRAGSWCRMSACGNQAKSRAHRERLRRQGRDPVDP